MFWGLRPSGIFMMRCGLPLQIRDPARWGTVIQPASGVPCFTDRIRNNHAIHLCATIFFYDVLHLQCWGYCWWFRTHADVLWGWSDGSWIIRSSHLHTMSMSKEWSQCSVPHCTNLTTDAVCFSYSGPIEDYDHNFTSGPDDLVSEDGYRIVFAPCCSDHVTIVRQGGSGHVFFTSAHSALTADVCTNCGSVQYFGDLFWHDENRYCTHCLSQPYGPTQALCIRCGEIKDTERGVDSFCICEDCVSFWCFACGAEVTGVPDTGVGYNFCNGCEHLTDQYPAWMVEQESEQ
jgi:hypothetical protein